MSFSSRAAVIVLAALGAVSSAHAAPSTAAITRDVVQAANHYIKAISCNSEDINGSNVAALVPLADDNEDGAKYAVVWNGDIGCAGGTATTSANIAIVSTGPLSEHFTVDPTASSPVVNFELPARGIEKFVGNTANTIVVDASEYGDNDPDCCPSIHKRYWLAVDKQGNWHVTKEGRVPNRK